MKPLIPYMRKSSREDPEASKDRQRRSIRAWAKMNNVPLAPEVWEPGVKGSQDWHERGLGQAIAACERGEAGGIVVEEQSRLSRENMKATAEVWEALERAGARLVCTAEGLDTGNGGDQELNYTIKAALAREQWKQYRRRAEAAKRRAVEEEGLHVGPPPFGYFRPALHERLQLDRKKGRVVREAFELRATGATLGEVVAFLNRRAPGGPSGSGKWTLSMVARMLGNRAYLGEARGGASYTHPGAHPAIVDQETFDTVQALASRVERPVEGRASASLLAGIVRCGSCGYAMDRSNVAGGYLVYRCRNRSAAGRCPATNSINYGALNDFVTEAALAALGTRRVREVPDGTTLVELRAKIKATEAKRKPYENPDFVAALGVEGATRALRLIGDELAELQRQLADVVVDEDTDELPDETTAREAWPTLSLEERRVILLAMIDDVVISRSPVRRPPVSDRARIVWKGEVSPIVRPTRGRRRNDDEVAARAAAA